MKYIKMLVVALLSAFAVYSYCVPEKTIEYKYIERDKNINLSIGKLSIDFRHQENRKAIATAFAITPDYLVTAAHYCASIENEEAFVGNLNLIFLNNNERNFVLEGVEVIAFDEKVDLCLLRLDNHGLIPLTVMTRYRKTMHIGDPIKVVGCPLGFFPVEADGKIVRVYEDGRGIISAPIGPGHSGSPVLDQNFHVVGVATSTFMVYQKVSFMAPANVLLKFLRDNGVYLR